jgi:hypothetical protein
VKRQERGIDAKGANGAHPKHHPKVQQQPSPDRTREHRHGEYHEGIAVLGIV